MTTWKPKKPRKKKPAKTSIDELSGQKKGLYQIITPHSHSQIGMI